MGSRPRLVRYSIVKQPKVGDCVVVRVATCSPPSAWLPASLRKRRSSKNKRLRRSPAWCGEPAGSCPRGGGLGLRAGYGTEPPKPYDTVCVMRCCLPYSRLAHSNLLPCVHMQGAAGLVAHLLCGRRFIPRASPPRYVDFFCTRQLGRQLFVGARFEGTA